MNAVAVGPIARRREGAGNGVALRGADWPAFWQQVCARLRRDGYRPNTLRLYRQILRDRRAFLRDRHGLARPGGITAATARGFLEFLCEKNVSWLWMATAIAVLRNAFDRLGGMQITARMVTPRRNWPLPETLSARELRLLLDALPSPRDRLLVALLAGCGLRVSEACRVRWAEFDRVAGALRLDDPSGLRSRTVAVPQGLRPLFEGLASISPPSHPLICGRNTGAAVPKPLSARQVERVFKAAAQRAGILKRVSPMVLRHSYALRRIVAGDNICAVQQALGHRAVETTLRYQACLPKACSPADPVSPALALRQATALLGRLSFSAPDRRSHSTAPLGSVRHAAERTQPRRGVDKLQFSLVIFSSRP